MEVSLIELILSTRNCQITTLWGLVIETTDIGTVVLKPGREIVIKPGSVCDLFLCYYSHIHQEGFVEKPIKITPSPVRFSYVTLTGLFLTTNKH